MSSVHFSKDPLPLKLPEEQFFPDNSSVETKPIPSPNKLAEKISALFKSSEKSSKANEIEKIFREIYHGERFLKKVEGTIQRVARDYRSQDSSKSHAFLRNELIEEEEMLKGLQIETSEGDSLPLKVKEAIDRFNEQVENVHNKLIDTKQTPLLMTSFRGFIFSPMYFCAGAKEATDAFIKAISEIKEQKQSNESIYIYPLKTATQLRDCFDDLFILVNQLKGKFPDYSLDELLQVEQVLFNIQTRSQDILHSLRTDLKEENFNQEEFIHLIKLCGLATREIDIQKSFLIQQEIDRSLNFRHILAEFQRILGPNTFISVNSKIALFALLKSPNGSRMFVDYLKVIQRKKLKTLESFERHKNFILDSRFETHLASEITGKILLDVAPGLEPLYHCYLSNLHHFIQGNIGNWINSQIVTDTMSNATGQERVLFGRNAGVRSAQKMKEVYLGKSQKNFSENDFSNWEEVHNLWVKNEWKTTDSQFTWTGCFKIKERDQNFYETKTNLSFNFEKFKIPKELHEKLFYLLKAHCDSDRFTKVNDPGEIAKEYRAFLGDADFWTWTDSSPRADDPAMLERSKEILSAYSDLNSALNEFAQQMKNAVAKALIYGSTNRLPIASTKQRIGRAAKIAWLSLDFQIKHFSFSNVKHQLNLLPKLKSIVNELRFNLTLNYSSAWVKERFVIATKLLKEKKISTSHKQIFLNALNRIEEEAQLAKALHLTTNSKTEVELLLGIKRNMERYSLKDSPFQEIFNTIRSEVQDSLPPTPAMQKELPSNLTNLDPQANSNFLRWLKFIEKKLQELTKKPPEEFLDQLNNDLTTMAVDSSSPYYEIFENQKGQLLDLMKLWKEASTWSRSEFLAQKESHLRATLEEKKEFFSWLVFFGKQVEQFIQVPPLINPLKIQEGIKNYALKKSSPYYSLSKKHEVKLLNISKLWSQSSLWAKNQYMNNTKSSPSATLEEREKFLEWLHYYEVASQRISDKASLANLPPAEKLDKTSPFYATFEQQEQKLLEAWYHSPPFTTYSSKVQELFKSSVHSIAATFVEREEFLKWLGIYEEARGNPLADISKTIHPNSPFYPIFKKQRQEIKKSWKKIN